GPARPSHVRCMPASAAESPRPSSSWGRPLRFSYFPLFFFNGTAPPEFYTLSLHDALPISRPGPVLPRLPHRPAGALCCPLPHGRSEEHTSELQSPGHLVCRLLLEKKKRVHRTRTSADAARAGAQAQPAR